MPMKINAKNEYYWLCYNKLDKNIGTLMETIYERIDLLFKY
jgi:hypothetical protein